MYPPSSDLTFQRKAVPGMPIGYESGSKAYRITGDSAREFGVSREDVVFVERGS
jgi:hypothetical protein